MSEEESILRVLSKIDFSLTLRLKKEGYFYFIIFFSSYYIILLLLGATFPCLHRDFFHYY